MTAFRATVLERFEKSIMPVTECGCWIWMKALCGDRYGSIRVNSKLEKAHRVSWELFKGEIPSGLHVLHTCDIPACVNPEHLFLGTPLDNARDKESKGRGNQPTGLRNGRHTKPERTCRGDDHPARKYPGTRVGSGNGRSILTDDDIIAIRSSPLPTRELKELYGVTKHHINRIRARKCWTHI